MPVRKSTRSQSPRRASKATTEPVSKGPLKSKVNAPKKRVASLDVAPPPTKRLRTKRSHNALPTVSAKVDHPPRKPFYLPLPATAPPTRPCLQLFVWGAGNFGQFGLGPDPEKTGEIKKPKKITWVDGESERDSELESIAAGGTHTVFIDEKGVVGIINGSSEDIVTYFTSRFGHAVSTMMLH
jgi:regulator of chromosome condensation